LLFPRKPLRGAVNGMTWPPCSIGSGAQIDRINGAEPAQLQSDITRNEAVDDNTFAAEIALIRENSFDIHPVGNHFVGALLNIVNPTSEIEKSSTRLRLMF
jgi:hypothetical protein